MCATEFLTCQAKPKSLTRQSRSPLAENSKKSHDKPLHQAFTKHLPANPLDLPLLPVLFHCAALRSAAWIKVGNRQPVNLSSSSKRPWRVKDDEVSKYLKQIKKCEQRTFL
jgi:hypothetical protein